MPAPYFINDYLVLGNGTRSSDCYLRSIRPLFYKGVFLIPSSPRLMGELAECTDWVFKQEPGGPVLDLEVSRNQVLYLEDNKYVTRKELGFILTYEGALYRIAEVPHVVGRENTIKYSIQRELWGEDIILFSSSIAEDYSHFSDVIFRDTQNTLEDVKKAVLDLDGFLTDVQNSFILKLPDIVQVLSRKKERSEIEMLNMTDVMLSKAKVVFVNPQPEVKKAAPRRKATRRTEA